LSSLFVMNIAVGGERIDPLVAGLEASEDLEISALSFAEERSGNWRLSAYFSNPPDPGTLAAVLKGTLGPDALLPEPLIEKLAEQDRVAKVQKELPPVRAGRFLVHGSHDRNRLTHSIHRLEIDAGQAFGTAHHGTTEGCLRALDMLLHHRRFKRIGDIGTGSGILATAAAKALPEAKIIASDVDLVALRVARQNFRKNGVHSHVESILAEGFRHPRLRKQRTFDLVFANLLAGPLKTIAREIANALRTNGYAILSGILDNQARNLEGHYRNFGFVIECRARIDGWTTVILRKFSTKRKSRRTGFQKAKFSGS